MILNHTPTITLSVVDTTACINRLGGGIDHLRGIDPKPETVNSIALPG
jgi:hypothetical protein